MCKILTLTNTSKVKSVEKLIRTAAELVGQTERDGFGYAMQGASGVFGERTTKPAGFRPSFKNKLVQLPFCESVYNRFGKYSKPSGAAIFHGRTSTNNINLINTHPIIKRDWTIIHNGVVSNHGPDYEALTSNDTEHLLEYLSTSGITGIEQHITGYYAVSALDPSGRLHIFRDSIASLYAAQITSIDSLIFATKESHIRELCKIMDWKYSVPSPVSDNTYLIFENGSLIHQQEFNPRGRTNYESRFASLSLGRELDNIVDASETVKPLDFGTVQTVEHDYWSPCGTKLDENEYMFLEEMKLYADSSYTIFNYRGDKITVKEFHDLDLDEKLCCEVVRADGTVCSPSDYYAEVLWQGAV